MKLGTRTRKPASAYVHVTTYRVCSAQNQCLLSSRAALRGASGSASLHSRWQNQAQGQPGWDSPQRPTPNPSFPEPSPLKETSFPLPLASFSRGSAFWRVTVTQLVSLKQTVMSKWEAHREAIHGPRARNTRARYMCPEGSRSNRHTWATDASLSRKTSISPPWLSGHFVHLTPAFPTRGAEPLCRTWRRGGGGRNTRPSPLVAVTPKLHSLYLFASAPLTVPQGTPGQTSLSAPPHLVGGRAGCALLKVEREAQARPAEPADTVFPGLLLPSCGCAKRTRESQLRLPSALNDGSFYPLQSTPWQILPI